MSIWIRLAYVAAFGIFMGGITFFIIYFNFIHDVAHSLYVVLAMTILGLIMGATFVAPATIWPISFTLTGLYFIAWLYILFQPYYYAKFLRSVGYGGGLPIVIKTKNQDSQKLLPNTTTSLILKTNETLIILDEANKSFLEVPRDEIIYVSYRTGGLSRMSIKLPSSEAQK